MEPMAAQDGVEGTARAKLLRQRIKAAGLTIAEFGRKAEFSRNTTYGIVKGRPLRPEEAARIDAILGPSMEEQVFVTQKRDS